MQNNQSELVETISHQIEFENKLDKESVEAPVTVNTDPSNCRINKERELALKRGDNSSIYDASLRNSYEVTDTKSNPGQERVFRTLEAYQDQKLNVQNYTHHLGGQTRARS